MKKELILLFLLILNSGCIFFQHEVSTEEKAKIPQETKFHKILNDYSEEINPKAVFYYPRFKTLHNTRAAYTPHVVCYNVTNQEEMIKIIKILQKEIQGDPCWYYINIRFYDKLNYTYRGSWNVPNANILLETKIKPEKELKEKIQQDELRTP